MKELRACLHWPRPTDKEADRLPFSLAGKCQQHLGRKGGAESLPPFPSNYPCWDLGGNQVSLLPAPHECLDSGSVMAAVPRAGAGRGNQALWAQPSSPPGSELGAPIALPFPLPYPSPMRLLCQDACMGSKEIPPSPHHTGLPSLPLRPQWGWETHSGWSGGVPSSPPHSHTRKRQRFSVSCLWQPHKVTWDEKRFTQINPHIEPVHRFPKALCLRVPCLTLHQTRVKFLGNQLF